MSKTKRIRVQVPIFPEAYEAYKALADVQRTSVAAVCGEILETAAPAVRELASALEMAKQSPTRALRDMADALDQLTAEASQLQIDLSDKLTPKATRRKYTKRAKAG